MLVQRKTGILMNIFSSNRQTETKDNDRVKLHCYNLLFQFIFLDISFKRGTQVLRRFQQKSPVLRSLPLTDAALELNVKRAHCQSILWHSCSDGKIPSILPCQVIARLPNNVFSFTACIYLCFVVQSADTCFAVCFVCTFLKHTNTYFITYFIIC